MSGMGVGVGAVVVEVWVWVGILDVDVYDWWVLGVASVGVVWFALESAAVESTAQFYLILF